MILDSSAIAAILLHQRGADRLVEAIATAELLAVAEPTLLETAIVITARLGDRARFLALDFVRESGAEVLPFEELHLSAAIDAYLRYGKGRHAAGSTSATALPMQRRASRGSRCSLWAPISRRPTSRRRSPDRSRVIAGQLSRLQL